MQVKTVQYGARRTRQAQPRSRRTGMRTGDAVGTQSSRRTAADFGTEIASHPMDDDYHRARSANWDKIVTPLFSAANWGGQGLHPRGNFEELRARLQAEMAGGAWHRTLDTFLHRLRTRAAAALLRLFPARQERRLGKTTEGAAAGTAHRQVRTSVPKANGRSSARDGQNSISTRQR